MAQLATAEVANGGDRPYPGNMHTCSRVESKFTRFAQFAHSGLRVIFGTVLASRRQDVRPGRPGGSPPDSAVTDPTGAPLAVVGLACRFPDADDPAALLDVVLTGRRTFRRLPPSRIDIDDYYLPDLATSDATYSTRAAVIDNWRFEPAAFGIDQAAYAAADPAHWLALETAARALAAAGLPGRHRPGPRPHRRHHREHAGLATPRGPTRCGCAGPTCATCWPTRSAPRTSREPGRPRAAAGREQLSCAVPGHGASLAGWQHARHDRVSDQHVLRLPWRQPRCRQRLLFVAAGRRVGLCSAGNGRTGRGNRGRRRGQSGPARADRTGQGRPGPPPGTCVSTTRIRAATCPARAAAWSS